MNQELPRCFADSAWTLVSPGLRDELKKRVHSRLARSVASHADASDVVQDALGAAIHHRALLKRLSPPQRANWFRVVLARLSAHLVRRRSKVLTVKPLTTGEAIRLTDLRTKDPASVVASMEQVNVVVAAMAGLPESWRRILALRDEHPNDWSAVADEYGLSTGAARALWYRALAGLRDRLLEYDSFRDEIL